MVSNDYKSNTLIWLSKELVINYSPFVYKEVISFLWIVFELFSIIEPDFKLYKQISYPLVI